MESVFSSLTEEVRRFCALASIEKEEFLRQGYLRKAILLLEAARIVAKAQEETTTDAESR